MHTWVQCIELHRTVHLNGWPEKGDDTKLYFIFKSKFDQADSCVIIQSAPCQLLITSASALGSVLDVVEHSFVCLRAVSSDTLLCQHMACPRVLNSSHAQMLVVRCLPAFLPQKIQHIRTDCIRNTTLILSQAQTWVDTMCSH